MCVYDGKGRWQVYGEVGVEANRVYVKQRDERSACVVGEFGENIWTDGCSRNDECVRPEGVRLREP